MEQRCRVAFTGSGQKGVRVTLILIDAKNALFRYGMRHVRLRSSDGKPTGAIYGILSMLYQMKKRYPDARFAMVWDDSRGWRQKEYPEYKGSRKAVGELPKDLQDVFSQMHLMRDVTKMLNIPQIQITDMEADDVIGILARRFVLEHKVIVHSSDKDFYQLMAHGVQVTNHGTLPVTEKMVKERFGVGSKDVLKVRILLGDSSDNISKPVKGIGPKGAVKLIEAGVDPLKRDAAAGMGGVKNEKLAAAWATVCRNRMLMKLLPSVESSRVSRVQRDQLVVWSRGIRHDLCSAVWLSPGQQRAWVKIMSELSMEDAIKHRGVLCSLQK